MAQTDTYANLLSLIEARMGASFGTTEQTRIKHLVNSRAHMAYRESELWENFLVIGEERAVNTAINTIPYTGAVYDNNSANDPYTGGPVDSFIRIHKAKPWSNKSVTEYEFAGDGTGARLIGYTGAYGLSKTPTVASNTSGTVRVRVAEYVDYYVGGTVQIANFATGTVDINGTHTITALSYNGWTQVTYAISDTTSHTFSLTGSETMKAPIAYCTYKKRLSGTTYGTASGETAAIPLEWFEYISHGVYSDMLRADQQFGAAQAEEEMAAMALLRELERLDSQKAAQSVGQSIFTHISEQGRAVNY